MDFFLFPVLFSFLLIGVYRPVTVPHIMLLSILLISFIIDDFQYERVLRKSANYIHVQGKFTAPREAKPIESDSFPHFIIIVAATP